MKPLITAGGLSKPGAHWTRPSALTQLVTRSRSPSSCSQRGEDRERRQPRRLLALLERQLAADAAGHQHLGAVHRQVPGDVGVLAADVDEVELELDPGRRRERARQLQPELGEVCDRRSVPSDGDEH